MAVEPPGSIGRVAWHLTTRLCPIRTRRGNDNFAYDDDGATGEAAGHLHRSAAFLFHRCEVMNSHEHDYFVIVTRRRHLWSWQIHRRSTPPGLRFRGGEFTTASAAEDAGQKALKAFLGSLPRDQD
jgi:hypothetical protein